MPNTSEPAPSQTYEPIEYENYENYETRTLKCIQRTKINKLLPPVSYLLGVGVSLMCLLGVSRYGKIWGSILVSIGRTDTANLAYGTLIEIDSSEAWGYWGMIGFLLLRICWAQSYDVRVPYKAPINKIV